MSEEKGTSQNTDNKSSEKKKDDQVQNASPSTDMENEQAAVNEKDAPLVNESMETAEEGKVKEDSATEEKEADQVAAEKVPAEEDDLEADSDQEEDDSDDDNEELPDYSNYTKEQLVEVIKEISHQDNFRRGDRILKEIKPVFDEIYEQEKQEALNKFLEEGGEPADFEMKHDELNERFDANFQLYKDRRRKYFKDLEKLRDENLNKKEEILEKLRELVDGEETITSLNVIKELQKEWKSIGQVPGAQARTLWANYNALLDRYYDQRSILHELKELDRKKNLEAKIHLCEKAEELAVSNDIPSAVKQLNELHEEYKHIGPVPKEEQEALWQRFKAASDAVYEKRKGYLDQLKEVQKENLVKKEAIIDKMTPYLDFNSDRIKDWNQKTKEILAIQKEWEAAGQVPKENAKTINKSFWSNFKQFFANKHEFFKRLDKLREENLNKKKELVEEAKSLQDSTDWNNTAGKLKKLQNQWREIGPVPEKYRESVYREFKDACDKFFENKRAGSKEAEKEYTENLKAKEAVIENINALEAGDISGLEALEQEYSSIGFVPRNDIQSNKEQFSEAINGFIEKSESKLTEEQLNKVKLMAQLTKIMAGPNANKKLNQKENAIRKKISDLNNDIVTWKTNLEFFASSKTADNLKKEFDKKIEEAEKEISLLKKQLRIVRSV